MKHYDVKIGFTNPVTLKKDSSTFIVCAENLVDVEHIVNEEYGSNADLEIEKVGLIKNTTFEVDNYNEEENKIFKCKVGIVTIDEKNGKEKVTPVTTIFNEKDFDQALKSVKEDLIMSEFIISLIETNYSNYLSK